MPRQARESSGTGFTAPVGEIDWDWEKHDISHVTKQVPVPVFPFLCFGIAGRRDDFLIGWRVTNN